MSEFSIIENYFSQLGEQRTDVPLGVGDDAAIVDMTHVASLAISVDTLIEGVHFPASTDPFDIGWKSLAVNLSDMAAMGAKPHWATLALSLPKHDEKWLKQFSMGFGKLAEKYGVQLIGGDTTRGALSITVQIMGSYNQNKPLLRRDAKSGDGIYTTGFLGDAALGLKSLSESLPLNETEKQMLVKSLNQPQPLVDEVLTIAPYINGCIDISDGLIADLSHILVASGKSAKVNVQQIPVSRSYHWCNSAANFYDLALCGGDDYQLCFTASVENEEKLLEEAERIDLRCTRIGEINEGEGLTLWQGSEQYTVQQHSYNHFSETY